MKISVIIPTYNRKANIIKTLICLERQVIEPQHEMEVIVVDHASTDGTSTDILSRTPSLNLKLLKLSERRNWDAATPRNYGAKVSLSDMLLFLDSDVMLPPDRIQRFIDDYLKDPDPNRIILGPYHNLQAEIDPEPDPQWYEKPISGYRGDIRWESFDRHSVEEKNQGFGFALACFGGSMFLPRRLFFKSGGYDETMINGGEDGDFGLTLWETGAVVSMDKGLLGWHNPHEVDEVRKSTPWDTVHRIDAKHFVDVIKETDKVHKIWNVYWEIPQLEDAKPPEKRLGEPEKPKEDGN